MIIDLLSRFLTPVLLRAPQPGLEINRIDVKVPELPADLHGLTLAHISDLHVGEGDWLPASMSEAVRAVKEASPDLVINTGDFMRHRPPIEKVLDYATRFSMAGVPHLAVLGNHDYYAGEVEVEELISGLEARGIRVLQNKVEELSIRNSHLTVAGLTLNAPGFENALATLSAAARPRLCLLHEPDLAEKLPRASDLVLGGHTHGGQIAIPFLTRRIVRRFSHSDYVAGMYRVRDMPVYVNSGLGFTGLPLRLGASPEVALLRLLL